MMSTEGTPRITLDQVFKAMQHWRNNKNQYESHGIPDDVWRMIFQLENQGYLSKDLKRTFSLNSKQYEERKNQMVGGNAKANKQIDDSNPTASADESSPLFCEAKITPDVTPNIPSLSATIQKNKRAVATLKSTANKPEDYLDMTTIIVEYIRPDGHRLKIHTTNESIDKLMSAFAQQGAKIND